jgi:hypothetical protein
MKTTFSDLSDAEIIPRTSAILTALSNDPELFPLILSLLSSPAKMEAALNTFQGSFDTSLTGDTAGKLARKKNRVALNSTLKGFTTIVHLAGLEEPSVIGRAGLRSQVRVSAPTPPLTAPTNFKVWHGVEHGEMISKITSVKTAKSYLMEFCEGDPTVESNWKFCGVYPTCSNMLIKDLVPGRVYSFRIRALRTSGPGPWSSYVTLMAI